MLRELTIQKTRQRQKILQEQKQLQRQSQKQKPPQKPIIILLPPGVKDTETVKRLIALSKIKEGVDVVAGQKLKKQRTIARNLPPFKAARLGRKFVDRNIEASYKLVRSGKKTRKKDIKPQNIGRKFRASKRDPLFIVERRAHRLDHPLERRQIKSFPKKKRKLTKKKLKKR